MADDTANASAAGAATNQNQSGYASPWDEPLDLPEDDADSSKSPKIVGSLDPDDKIQEQEKPVPFNIPEEVVEEKVGKKIPAEQVMGHDKPFFSETPATADKPASSITNQPNSSKDSNFSQTNKSGLPSGLSQVSDAAGAADFTTPAGNQKSGQSISASAPAVQNQQTVATVAPDKKPVEKPAFPSATVKAEASAPINDAAYNAKMNETAAPAQKAEGGISELILPKADKPEAVSSSVATAKAGEPGMSKPQSVALSPQQIPEEDKDEKGGISELLLGDDDNQLDDPFASPPLAEPPTLSRQQAAPATGPVPTVDALLSRQSGEAHQPAAPTNQLANNKKAFDITAPAAKSPVTAPTTAANTPKPAATQPASVAASSNQQISTGSSPVKAAKQSFFSRINPFAKRHSKEAVGTTAMAAGTGSGATVPSATASAPKTTAAIPGMMPSKAKKISIKLSPKLSIIFSVVLLLAAGIYLTEIGLASFGFENVYGAIGIQKIWGGLPKSSEAALAMAVGQGQNHLNFKYKGTISATIDKTKTSPVASPFISYGTQAQPLADIMLGAKSSALLSQYDYYGNSTEETADNSVESSGDEYYPSSSGDTSSSSSSSSDLGTSSTGTSSTSSSSGEVSDVNSPTPSESENSATSSESALSESTIKQIKLEASGASNDSDLSSELTLKPLVGADKYISLMATGGNLYVKSSDITFNEKSVKGKWLGYQFAGFESENTYANFLNINTDSGFSITGSRVANEKLADGVRAYKYKIENMEIGDTFQKLGITKETIESVNGYIWIGVRDHLIHKIDIDIMPSVSAAFTKINCALEFYDYDVSNEITMPVFDDVVTIESAASNQNETSGEAAESENTSSGGSQNSSSSSSGSAVTSSSQRTTADSQRHSDLVSIQAALNQYKARYGYYPKSGSFENISLSGSVLNKTIVPRYISTLPSDPKEAEGWWYGYKSDGKNFTLSARFENINDSEVTKVGSAYLHYVHGN